MSKIKELNERRAAVVEQMRALTAAAEQRAEKDLTAEELETFEALRAQRDNIDAQLRVAEELENEDKRFAASQNKRKENNEDKESLEVRAFVKHIKGEGLTEEERTALTITAGGAALVPTTVQDEILIGIQGTYGILPHIDLTVSDSAETQTFPVATAPITLEKIQVGSKSTEGSANFIGVQLSAYDFRTQPIPVSETLLSASNADVKAAIVALFVEHIGAALSARIITAGTDNKDFAAILSEAPVVQAEGATEITYEDVINLMSAVKGPFDAIGRAKFVVSSATRKALWKIRDNQGMPIYVRDVAGAGPATLFGHEVVVDDAMPAIGTKNKCMIFGDLKTYKCRLVKGVRVRTYDEQQYADIGCIGVQGFVTGDGRPVRAEGVVEPLAVLQNA
jgi:HK97 family phage major capsid protein